MSDDDGLFANSYADFARKFLDHFLATIGENMVTKGLRKGFFADVIAAEASDERVAAMVTAIVATALIDDLRLAVDVDEDLATALGQIIQVVWGENLRENP